VMICMLICRSGPAARIGGYAVVIPPRAPSIPPGLRHRTPRCEHRPSACVPSPSSGRPRRSSRLRYPFVFLLHNRLREMYRSASQAAPRP
jgi:hypothetical protein